MKKTYNKSIIIMIIMLASGVYLSFLNVLDYGSFIKVANASSLTSSSGFISSAISSLSLSNNSSDKISSDTAFLTTLTSLKNIKINTTIFSNKFFISLKNNSVKIDPVNPGRVNPFSPVGINNKITNNTTTPKVVTDQPTGITTKSVILNGTVNITNEKVNTYFEYGNTTNLGTVTTIVQPSLVGNFIKNISDLAPKTNYLYRACANINNITTCGEVVSFNTN